MTDTPTLNIWDDDLASSEGAPVAYPVTALVRDTDAALRALLATRDLIRLVAELEDGAAVAVELATGREHGALELTVELHGSASRELTAAELRSALGEAVQLGDPGPVRALPPAPRRQAWELARASIAPVFSPDVDEPLIGDRPAFDGPGHATPFPNTGDSGQRLLEVMAAATEPVRIRTVIAPASELEAQLVVDELNATVVRADIAGLAGVPVRVRTVVIGDGVVPPSVRARLRQRSPDLRLERTTPESAAALWLRPADAVRGFAVSEAHAIALARIPAAGHSTRPLGLATVRPVVRARPLDPVPAAPAVPIRLGWALDAFGRRIDVVLGLGDLRRHIYVEGASGSGKTTAIRALACSLIGAGHTVVYLDPHGDGAAAVAAFAQDAAAPALYLRHGDREAPVGLNPIGEPDPELRGRGLSSFLELLQEMVDPGYTGMLGERGKRSITLLAEGAYAVIGPTASVDTVVTLALDQDNVRMLADAVRDGDGDLARRLDAELGRLPEKEYTELVSWLVSRLQPFVRSGPLRSILGPGTDSVDLVGLLENGTSLIVDLASMDLGEEVATVLGALWILKLRAAIGRRANRDRTVVVIIDEAWLYRFGALPALLQEARKFGVGVCIATQSVDNLSPRLAHAVEANAGSHVSLRTGVRGAVIASERLGGWPASELVRLDDLTAGASLSRDGVPTPAFTLHIDHHERIAADGWTPNRIRAAADDLAGATRRKLGLGPLAVRSDTETLGLIRAAARAGRRASAARAGLIEAGATVN